MKNDSELLRRGELRRGSDTQAMQVGIGTLKNNLRRRGASGSSSTRGNVLPTQYRPFVKQHCYVATPWSNNADTQMDSIFPPPHVDALARRHCTDRPTAPTLSGNSRPTERSIVPGVGVRQTVLRDDGRHHAGSRTGVEGSVLSALPLRAANRVICTPGRGATKPFSILVADHMPDLHFLEFGQCFPRWVYPAYRGHL